MGGIWSGYYKGECESEIARSSYFYSPHRKEKKNFSEFLRCDRQSPPPKTVRFLLAQNRPYYCLLMVRFYHSSPIRSSWLYSHICRIKYPPQTGQFAIRFTKNSHVLGILCSYFSLFGIDARDRSRLFTDLLLEEAYSRSKLLMTVRTLT